MSDSLKFVDKILDRIDERQAKRLQRKLIKTNDDEQIVDALPPDKDNSKVDIYEVVKSMENPENKLEVVSGNIEEMIEQDVVRDTLKHLPDKSVETILKENEEKFAQYKKMKNAIQAIKSNERKLNLTEEYFRTLNDIDLIEIFATMKPEQDSKKQEWLEQKKVRIIAKKIVEHVKKHGSVWHVAELTESLRDRAKLSVLNLCLGDMSADKVSVNSVADHMRVNFVGDLLRVTNISYKKKNMIVRECRVQNLLTEEEEAKIKLQLQADRARKDRI